MEGRHAAPAQWFTYSDTFQNIFSLDQWVNITLSEIQEQHGEIKNVQVFPCEGEDKGYGVLITYAATSEYVPSWTSKGEGGDAEKG